MMSPVLKLYTFKNQQIVSWASKDINPDFNSGRWIMTGNMNLRNYMFSGVSTKAPYSNYQETVINSDSLQYPKGYEYFKVLLGQIK